VEAVLEPATAVLAEDGDRSDGTQPEVTEVDAVSCPNLVRALQMESYRLADHVYLCTQDVCLEEFHTGQNKMGQFFFKDS